MNKYIETSILLPTKNHEKIIKRNISFLRSFMGEHFQNYEILIISNNSSLENAKILEESFFQDPNIRIKFLDEKGKGSAVRWGLNNSKYKNVILYDSDFSYSFDQKTSDKEITKFYDFSKMPNYDLPHKYNTTKKAAQIENETLKLTIEPGMRGASFDKKFKKTERAELGFKMPINGTLYYSFKMKTPEGFKSVDEQFEEVRTMITQVKTPPATHSSSPPVAVYVDNYGSAKCLEYKKMVQKLSKYPTV